MKSLDIIDSISNKKTGGFNPTLRSFGDFYFEWPLGEGLWVNSGAFSGYIKSILSQSGQRLRQSAEYGNAFPSAF